MIKQTRRKFSGKSPYKSDLVFIGKEGMKFSCFFIP